MRTLTPCTWHLTPCALCFHAHSGLERSYFAAHRPQSACLDFRVEMSTLEPLTWNLPFRRPLFSITSPVAPSFSGRTGVGSEEPGVRIGAPAADAFRLRISGALFCFQQHLRLHLHFLEEQESGMRSPESESAHHPQRLLDSEPRTLNLSFHTHSGLERRSFAPHRP